MTDALWFWEEFYQEAYVGLLEPLPWLEITFPIEIGNYYWHDYEALLGKSF